MKIDKYENQAEVEELELRRHYIEEVWVEKKNEDGDKQRSNNADLASCVHCWL